MDSSAEQKPEQEPNEQNMFMRMFDLSENLTSAIGTPSVFSCQARMECGHMNEWPCYWWWWWWWWWCVLSGLVLCRLRQVPGSAGHYG